MKKITGLFVVLIAVVVFSSKTHIASALTYSYCPGATQLSGWWGSFTPSTRQCSTDYYTWNTNSGISTEESWFLSNAIYVSCHKGTPPAGPTYYDNLIAGVYIPSPDSSQTHSAHYYRWQDSSHWGLIGTVDQYNTFGWANLVSTTYSFVDQLKLSDWTNDATKYSKHVDLDAYRFQNCPT